jgi:hypothetical protein
MRGFLLALVALVTAQPAQAEMTKSQFTAPNGVIVTVNTDDFAGRREFSSPFIEFKPDGGGIGAAMVGRVFNAGKLLDLNVQGFVSYSGDWRFYNSAIFKGGEPAKFHRTGSDVGSCRYGCTLSESFMIDITPEEAKAHSENGIVAIQIRGGPGATGIIQIPLTYFEAVNAVAH